MNDSEPKPSVPSPSASQDWQEQFATLQRQVSNLLLALVVLSCTFTLFIMWQARQIKHQYELVKQQATVTLQQKSRVDTFLSQLAKFGRARADFVPILNKYNIPLAATPAVTSAPPAATKTPRDTAPKK